MATKQRHLNKTEKAKAKEAFLAAFKKSGAVLKDACAATGIPRRTVCNWRQQDPDFDAACSEAQEIMLDEAESRLIAAVRRGNFKAICFYLVHKGRARGYDAHQDIDLTATVLRPRVVFEEDGD